MKHFFPYKGRDEFMGRCVESPVVKLNGQAPPAPRLLWEPVKKGTEDGGEILVAFELFLVSVVAYMEKNFFLILSGTLP